MPAFTLEASLVARTSHGLSGFHIQGTGQAGGDNWVLANQAVGSSAAEALAGGESSETSLLLLRNAGAADITLYADGAAGTKPVGLLKPGEFALFQSYAAPSALGVRAASGTQLLDLMIIERPTITAAVALNSLAPLAPAANQVSARARLLIEPQSGISLGLDCAFTAPITSAGLLSPVNVQSATNAWPAAVPHGGARYGVWGAVNVDTSIEGFEDYVALISNQTGSHTFGSILGRGHPAIVPWHNTAADFLKVAPHNLSASLLLMVTREA